MSKEIQIREAIKNAEANVELLATLPDRKLTLNLDTIHIQMELAEQKNNTAALELLEIWRSQVIAARIYKAENNIPDAINEIELANFGIERTVTKTEKQESAFKEFNLQVKQSSTKKQVKEDNDSQLTLF